MNVLAVCTKELEAYDYIAEWMSFTVRNVCANVVADGRRLDDPDLIISTCVETITEKTYVTSIAVSMKSSL
jgi:hypothetical protein